MVITIKGKQHWLWRAVDQHGYVLEVLVQSRRNTQAAERLMRKLLRKHAKAPRVMVIDKLKSYAAANRSIGLKFEHRQRKGLNNRAENSHQPTWVRGKVMRLYKSACQLQRFLSVHDQVVNQFMHCRYLRCQTKARTACPGVCSLERGDLLPNDSAVIVNFQSGSRNSVLSWQVGSALFGQLGQPG